MNLSGLPESTNVEFADKNLTFMQRMAAFLREQGARTVVGTEKSLNRALGQPLPPAGFEAGKEEASAALINPSQSNMDATRAYWDDRSMKAAAKSDRWMTAPHHQLALGTIGMGRTLFDVFQAAAPPYGPSAKDWRNTGHGAYERFRQGQAAAAQVQKNMPAAADDDRLRLAERLIRN